MRQATHSNPLRDLLLDFERDRQRRELERIAADPAACRDTVLMGARGLRYRYWEIKTGKSAWVRHCYATRPNAAGYFLCWREQLNSKGEGKREFIRGHKRRRDARESALKSYEREKE